MYATKTIKVPIYEASLQVIITSNIVKVHNRINNYHKTGTFWKKEDDAAGCTILVSTTKYYIIINNSYLTHNTISHELYHCVCNMANDRGIHEEESRAWLQGVLAQDIYNFLKEKNIKVG